MKLLLTDNHKAFFKAAGDGRAEGKIKVEWSGVIAAGHLLFIADLFWISTNFCGKGGEDLDLWRFFYWPNFSTKIGENLFLDITLHRINF